MTQPSGAFRSDGPVQRGWRPLLMWILLLTVALPVGVFMLVLMAAFTYGVVKSVTTGQPMPYLLGGIEHLPWAQIGAGIGALVAGYLARGRQIVQQDQARGGAGYTPPFPQSPPPPSASTPPEPSPTGGLVNNEALNQ
jgi:hypothetical protein